MKRLGLTVLLGLACMAAQASSTLSASFVIPPLGPSQSFEAGSRLAPHIFFGPQNGFWSASPTAAPMMGFFAGPEAAEGRAGFVYRIIGDGLMEPWRDSVTVTAIPEPEIYAMMIAGLGLLGFIARRRRNLLDATA